MAKKDYYEIPSVAKDAGEAETKKAYRRLMRRYHPDVSKEPDTAEHTVEINRACETLSDKEKRAEYDKMLANPYGHSAKGNPFSRGSSPLDSGFNGDGFHYERREGEPFGAGDFNFEDLFLSFCQSHTRSEQPRGLIEDEDQHAELGIDIYVAYVGAGRSMTLNVSTLDEYGRMVYQNRTLNVKIPRGIAESQQIRLAGQGLPGCNDGENDNLYSKIRFHDQPDLYVKNRKDVYQTIDVRPQETVLGGKIIAPAASGRLQVNLPTDNQSDKSIRLKGKSIPAEEVGDLYLGIRTNVPPVKNEADRAVWEKLAEHFATKQT